MLRMFNLDKWRALNEGQAIAFNSRKPRVVRLEVNSTGKTQLFVSMRRETEQDPVPQESVRFLVLVEGRQTVEFHTSGQFSLLGVGDECFVYTVDGESYAYVDEGETFTKLAQRRQRSPEIEYVSRLMNLNMEKRLAQQAAEFRRLLAARGDVAAPVAPNPVVSPDVRADEPAPVDPEGPSGGGRGAGRGRRQAAPNPGE